MHLLHKMSFVGGGNIFKSYILSASTFELCLEFPPPPFFWLFDRVWIQASFHN